MARHRHPIRLDGVTTLGTVTDQRGRKGVAVAYTRRGDGSGRGQTRLIIDPRTGHALAEESWHLDGSTTGTLVGYRSVAQAGWTDAAPPRA